MLYTQVTSALLVVAGMFLVFVGKRQSADKVPFNSSLGTRTWDTRRSEKAWRAGNRAAGPYSVSMGGVAMVCGAGGFILAQSTEFGALAAVSIAIVAILVLTGVQVKKANDAARHADS